MQSRSLARMMCALAALTLPVELAAQVAPPGVQADEPHRTAHYAQLPLMFERNQGQTDAQVKFVAHGKGYSAFLTAGGIVLSLRPTNATSVRQSASGLARSKSRRPVSTALQFKLLGASQNPAIVGEEPQPGRINYFLGRDPAKWQRNIPTYARVRYKNVYPGIDLLYYGNHQQLEYDFAVAPGADPGKIEFEIRGASQIRIDAKGDLVLTTASGTLDFQTPVVFQESASGRIPVKGSYVLGDSSRVTFKLAQYDSSQPLVIDPVLVYSTYLGGSGDDQPAGIAVDATGSIYLAGSTDSTDFPLAALGTLPTGAEHVFVAKLDASGSNLVYADYIGGNGQDYGYALGLDSSNEIYVTGSTASSDFPMVHAFQGTYPGSFNAFLTRISADGSSLLYSTYLGGNGSDEPAALAIDSLGSAIVAGNTSSTNFPVANAYQPSASANQGGVYGNYGFLTKFSPDGSSLIYSTYLSGNTNVPYNCGGTPCWGSPYSAVSGIAVDSSGNAYATGDTNTYNFPTTSGVYQATNSTEQNSNVGFVTKLDGSGNLGYSTYFYESSGIQTDLKSIAVDSSGAAYVAGVAFSDGTFPITSTSICDPSVSGIGCDFAFVTKFDPTGASLAYSTFLGPNNGATPQAIALDANNDAYVLAATGSSTFTTVNGIESYSDGNDLLLVEIDPLASTQLFATYLGASGSESPAGLALDSGGNIYVGGTTDSADLPITPGALQLISGGGSDAFVLKIGPASEPSVTFAPALLQFPELALGLTSQPQTVLLRNLGSAALSMASIRATGDFAENDDCSPGVPAADSCTFSVTFTPTVPGVRNGAVVIQDNAAGSPHRISLSGTGFGQGVSLAPTSLTFPSQPLGIPSTAQTVTLTNSGNAPLAVSAINASGDYSQTNNCPASLTAGAGCTITVTFTPTALGSRNGTLMVTDDATGSPHSVTLTGTGVDFALASTPTSRTVNAGSSASYSLTISALGGSFTSAVRLTCGGLPAKASCSFSSSSVTPGGNSADSTLSITTAGSTQGSSAGAPRIGPMYAVWIQVPAFALLGILLAVPSTGRKTSGRKNSGRIRGGILLGLAVIFLLGCGGTGIVAPPHSGTPPGTYTVTVTGAAGALQHSLPVTLTVQ